MIAVVGGASISSVIEELAFEVGRAIAASKATLVCGGRGGVMAAAARGARSAAGHTIGIIPGYERAEANPYIEFTIVTGMGQARNVIVVASADAVIAMAGEGGTLSEIGLALKLGRPVIGLRAWAEIAGIEHLDHPVQAVRRALELANQAVLAHNPARPDSD